MILRTVTCGSVQRISNDHLFRFFDLNVNTNVFQLWVESTAIFKTYDTFEKFVVNVFGDKQPTGCDTIFAFIEENSAQSLNVQYRINRQKICTISQFTCRTARSKSQSENMIKGDFPPNSNEQRLILLSAQLKR